MVCISITIINYLGTEKYVEAQRMFWIVKPEVNVYGDPATKRNRHPCITLFS